MSATNILQKIQDKLIKTYAGDVQVKSDEIEEMFGPGFTNQYPDSSDDNSYDVTNATAVDVPYTTNVPAGSTTTKKSINKMKCPMSEAKKEDKKKSDNDEDDVSADAEADMAVQAGEEEIEDATGDELETPEDEGAEKDIAAAEKDAAGEDPGVPEGGEETMPADDMGGGDMGDTAAGDPSMGGDLGGDMGGMGDIGGIGEEEEKSSSEIGRIYELKKIYTRLTSIEAYLGDESDQELLEIRNYVSQGIELFEIVSANFDSYKEKLDEVIVMYYKFLLEVYKSVKDFYSKQKKSGD